LKESGVKCRVGKVGGLKNAAHWVLLVFSNLCTTVISINTLDFDIKDF
jgi:hypothetical protein